MHHFLLSFFLKYLHLALHLSWILSLFVMCVSCFSMSVMYLIDFYAAHLDSLRLKMFYLNVAFV